MCGRFATTGDLDFYGEYFGVDAITTEPADPSWNVAPTDESYVVAEHEDRRLLGRMKWGILPSWAKDARAMQINARIETVATAPTFKRALSLHRCIVPADGFYEWEPKQEGRTPHWIYRADGYPMGFAGIWAGWRQPGHDQWERRFAIITTGAEGVVAPIHDRMPVILPADVWQDWLDRDLTDPEQARALIRTIDPDLLMEYPVHPRVNNVRNNGPQLLERANPEAGGPPGGDARR